MDVTHGSAIYASPSAPSAFDKIMICAEHAAHDAESRIGECKVVEMISQGTP